MRDTETSLIAALQLGQIDYLAIYRSDALATSSEIYRFAEEINLSDPAEAAACTAAVAHTKNGDVTGTPIVYAVTTVTAVSRRLRREYVALFLGPQGQGIMKDNGFGTFSPAYAVHAEAMPADLRDWSSRGLARNGQERRPPRGASAPRRLARAGFICCAGFSAAC